MKILLCVSHVPDTTSKIKFTNNNTAFETKDIQYIIGPLEELGLTRMLELKETVLKDAKIVAINVGTKETEATLRKALAVGADEAIRVEAEPFDAEFVAQQIAEVCKNEHFDIIVTGKESIDFNSGLVGGMIAEMLDIPLISSCSKIDFVDNVPILEREIDGGKELVSTTLPFVATAQKGFAVEPRIPSMRGIMAARTKKLTVVQAVNNDLKTKVIRYDLPPAKGKCKMIDSENVGELVRLLHEEAKLI